MNVDRCLIPRMNELVCEKHLGCPTFNGQLRSFSNSFGNVVRQMVAWLVPMELEGASIASVVFRYERLGVLKGDDVLMDRALRRNRCP